MSQLKKKSSKSQKSRKSKKNMNKSITKQPPVQKSSGKVSGPSDQASGAKVIKGNPGAPMVVIVQPNPRESKDDKRTGIFCCLVLAACCCILLLVAILAALFLSPSG